MLEIIIGTLFAIIAYVATEYDNKDSELYKLLHQK
jgi:hypothetical protein